MRRAFSLMELLVGTGLMALSLFILVSILIPMLRTASRNRLEMEARQVTQLVLKQLVDTLQAAPPEAIQSDLPNWLLVQQLQGVTPSGQRQFSDHLHVYQYQPEPRSLRLFQAIPDSLSLSLPSHFSLAQVSAFQPKPSTQRLYLKGLLRHFSVRPNALRGGELMQIQLEVEIRDSLLKFRETVKLRNVS